MPFSIRFLDEPSFYDEERHLACGELQIRETIEGFCANLYDWNRSAYEAQWKMALERVLAGKKSALMVYYVNPEVSDNMEWWPMYPVGDTVYLQNHLPWYRQFSEPFRIEDMYSVIPDRRTVSEDGDLISEWAISRTDIEQFLLNFNT